MDRERAGRDTNLTSDIVKNMNRTYPQGGVFKNKLKTNMKKTMTVGAVAIALLTAMSCSQTETDVLIETGSDDDQVALGISPNLRVDAGTKVATKSVVSGDLIAYDAAKYADDAPGLGVLVTNSGSTGWYTPDGTDYTGHHVWYMGNEKGAGWISIKAKGNTFALTREAPYYLTKTIGKVYAYYPYDATITSSLSGISSEADLKIPVAIVASGTIDATKNNAKKYWNNSAWTSSKSTDLVNLSLATEKDYLYFAGTDGRNVNNGRADGEAPVLPEADPDNMNANNPGYKINLDMRHGLSMISFRVYDGGKLTTADVNFTKFQVKNSAAGASPFKMGGGSMSLVDGAITGVSTAGDINRTVTGYVLMRQVEGGETEGEHAFVSTGTTTTSINGKTVSKSVSAIVYPTVFSDGDIEAVITLKEGSNSAVDYTIALPGNTWEANSNYIYTLSAGRNKLTVMDVTVEAWADEEQEEIPL